MVIPDPPVKAVNTAQLARTTIANPPGIHPMSACARATMRCGALLSARKYPETVNSGIARRTGWLARRYISTMIAAVSIPWEENPSSDIVPMIEKSGAPKRTRTARARTK